MDELDDDFIDLEADDDDLIELAPVPKRLKRMEPKRSTDASKTSAKVKSPSKKQLAANSLTRSPEKEPKKRGRKLKSLVTAESEPSAPLPAIMQVDAREEIAHISDEEFGDIEFEDADEGEQGGRGQLEPQFSASSESANGDYHELDIKMDSKDADEDDEKKSNPKKRKRETTGPKKEKKKRGSKKERLYTVNWHNMHLLMCLGHAIYSRNQSDTHTLEQALMVSLLPFELFQEIVDSDARSANTAYVVWVSTLRRLLKWFHSTFEMVDPLPSFTPIRSAPVKMSASASSSAPSMVDLTMEEDQPKPPKRVAPVDPVPAQDVHRKFSPLLFSSISSGKKAKRPKISHIVAVRLFSTLLSALDIPFRTVWALDEILAPFVYADWAASIPTTPYSDRILTSAIHRGLKSRSCTSKSAQSSSTASREIPEMSDTPPRVWFELYHPVQDKWIHVDLVRLLIDLPEAWNVTQLDQLSEKEVDETAKKKSSKSPVKRGKGPKFGELKCGYIIAVGQNGILTHVSPRYAKSYSEPLARIADTDWFFDFIRSWNAPLKEQLVSASSKNRSLVKMIRKMEQCDEREMDEIAQQEPMPTVVSAFKNHPLYVLERDILKFEVLRPNHSAPVAKVHEHDVYLRKDLSPIHTSDKWIQEGMQVKAGEKPVLEMIKRSMVNWDTVRKTWVDEDQAEMSEYYGDWQIEKFQPPVAENGLVPKNRYGNVYLFKPDMLPIGTVHLPGYPHLDKSVRKIGIDVAPAMTGWTVEGYWSIPQLDGWVVCKENVDLALDAWQQDAAKREADAIKKIKDRATQHWLNLAKQLMLKEKMEKSQKEAEAEASSSSLITESKVQREEVAESATSTRKAAQHTHSFPPSLYTTSDDGVITRHCACGYTDTLQRL